MIKRLKVFMNGQINKQKMEIIKDLFSLACCIFLFSMVVIYVGSPII